MGRSLPGKLLLCWKRAGEANYGAGRPRRLVALTLLARRPALTSTVEGSTCGFTLPDVYEMMLWGYYALRTVDDLPDCA